MEVIPNIISREQNAKLERLPSIKEIKEVVFAMDGESTAGPDGFMGKFFTFAWDVVGHDVFETIVSFFCGHELPRSVTSTSIIHFRRCFRPKTLISFDPSAFATL